MQSILSSEAGGSLVQTHARGRGPVLWFTKLSHVAA